MLGDSNDREKEQHLQRRTPSDAFRTDVGLLRNFPVPTVRNGTTQ